VLEPEVATHGEAGVEDGTGVPLRQEETVPVGPSRVARVDPQDVEVEGRHDVGRREGPAGVTGLGLVDHVEDAGADFPGLFGEKGRPPVEGALPMVHGCRHG